MNADDPDLSFLLSDSEVESGLRRDKSVQVMVEAWRSAQKTLPTKFLGARMYLVLRALKKIGWSSRAVSETDHEPPMAGQLYATVEFGASYGPEGGGTITTDIEKANVITSLVENSLPMHKLVVDIDFPVVAYESSTPGHSHLFIDKEIEPTKYWALLKALADAGLVEENYQLASEVQQHSAVRLPWIKKDVPPSKSEALATAEKDQAPWT